MVVKPPADGAGRYTITWEVHAITAEVAEDPEAAAMVEECAGELSKQMEKTVGYLGCPLDTRFSQIRTKETNASNWIADVMLNGTGADVAILNAGTLRADEVVPAGEFKLRDLVKLLPMLDELCVLGMSGKQLLSSLENGDAHVLRVVVVVVVVAVVVVVVSVPWLLPGVSQYPKLEGRFPCLAGVKLEFDPNAEPGARIRPESVHVGGEVLQLEGREYSVVTKASIYPFCGQQ